MSLAAASAANKGPARPRHRWRVRVYYEDVDLAGIVYYANYLRFFERGRTEMLRDAGVDQTVLKERDGVVFAVRRCAVDYLAPARFDDVLDVVTEVRDRGHARLVLDQRLERPAPPDGTAEAEPLVLTRAEVVIACLSLDGRPTRLPAAMAALTERLGGR